MKRRQRPRTPLPDETANDVIVGRTVTHRETLEICGRTATAEIEIFEVKCPVQAVCPPQLKLGGELPELWIGATDEGARLHAEGSTISFGATTVEFLGEAESIRVGDRTYPLGRPGDGFSYQFKDGALVAAFRATVPAEPDPPASTPQGGNGERRR